MTTPQKPEEGADEAPFFNLRLINEAAERLTRTWAQNIEQEFITYKDFYSTTTNATANGWKVQFGEKFLEGDWTTPPKPKGRSTHEVW